jgi:hypothetical protein
MKMHCIPQHASFDVELVYHGHSGGGIKPNMYHGLERYWLKLQIVGGIRNKKTCISEQVLVFGKYTIGNLLRFNCVTASVVESLILFCASVVLLSVTVSNYDFAPGAAD